MNTDQPTPPEVAAPAGHEILTPEFLRIYGAVEMAMQYIPKPFNKWVRLAFIRSDADLDGKLFSAPIGTIAAKLTPAPAGYRNVLPGWLAEQETKPEGLMWACKGADDWEHITKRTWQEFRDRDVSDKDQEDWLTDFAYAVPILQKGGDQPCATSIPTLPKSSTLQNEKTTNVAVASNAAPTFQPDARPWLPIAEYDREKHGEWVECKWDYAENSLPTKVRWHAATERWKDERGDGYGLMPPTHFRLPAPSVPTSGTPRCDAHIQENGYLRLKYVEPDFARTLEKELASVTREREEAKRMLRCAIEEKDMLRQQLLAAQNRADVAERERDEAWAKAGRRDQKWITGILEACGTEITFDPPAFETRHISTLEDPIRGLRKERDTALAELSEMQAKFARLNHDATDLARLSRENGELRDTQLAHLRAESLRLVSANDALKKERDGLMRQNKDYALATAQAESFAADMLAKSNDSLKMLRAAQAAEARLRGLSKELNDVPATLAAFGGEFAKGMWEGYRYSAKRILELLSTPPTAALPDGEELLDWLEANKERIFCLAWEPRDNEWRISANPTDSFSGAEILGEASTLRAAIRAAITGATK